MKKPDDTYYAIRIRGEFYCGVLSDEGRTFNKFNSNVKFAYLFTGYEAADKDRLRKFGGDAPSSVGDVVGVDVVINENGDVKATGNWFNLEK